MFKTTMKITGMMCGMCEAHINDAIRREFKIKKVTSSRGKGETVILSEQTLDEEKLKATVSATGYTPLSVTSEQYVKKGLFNR